MEMVIESNVLQSHPVGAGVLLGSAVSPILFPIHTAGLMNWVDERVQGVGDLSFVADLGLVPTREDVNQVVRKLEACAAESIDLADRRDLQFDTAKTEAALFAPRKGHKMHLRQKLTTNIMGGDGLVRFNKDATWWLGIWMDAHLLFKEHQNRCMKKARTAEAQLHVLTRLHGTVPEQVRAFQVACVQPVERYGSKLS